MAAPSLAFCSRRSVVFAARGMVASSQPLATAIGLDILKRGGNAADAAVAVAAALNVTEPCSTGIGGDCFALYYNAAAKTVEALNGSGRAPAGLTLERAAADCPGAAALPPFHAHTVTVPGAAAGWADTLEKWGSMTLPDVLAPSIELAQHGFPVAPVTAYHWEAGMAQLRGGAHGEELMLDGRAPRAGELFRNPHLAETLRALALNGKDGFYRGRVADAIVSVVQARGGALTHSDLVSHTSAFPEPIRVNFAGVDVLEILRGVDLHAMGHNSADYLHHLIEALRLAFADARWHVADPDMCPAPLDRLLSESYAAAQRQRIRPMEATADVARGAPFAGSDTVCFQVVDAHGNCCSFINSNYMGFGTGLVPQGCGFTLQNRGANFVLEAGHPNVLAPSKRPYHTIIPGLAVHPDGSLYCGFSVMGGFMQPQGHVQVMANMRLFNMDPQQALDAPRLCIEPSDGSVALEEGIAAEVVAELQRRGHRVRVVSGHARALFGRGQIIARDAASGVLAGGSDGRADGCALGY